MANLEHHQHSPTNQRCSLTLKVGFQAKDTYYPFTLLTLKPTQPARNFLPIIPEKNLKALEHPQEND